MNLSDMFSDDQMAIIGCFAALSVCGLIAMISFHFGPANRTVTPGQTSLPMTTGSKKVESQRDRKAA